MRGNESIAAEDAVASDGLLDAVSGLENLRALGAISGQIMAQSQQAPSDGVNLH